MKGNDLSMNGEELFFYYTSLGEDALSPEGEYNQTLMTLFLYIGDDLFPILEKAHRENKRIKLIETQDPPHDHYGVENIILV